MSNSLPGIGAPLGASSLSAFRCAKSRSARLGAIIPTTIYLAKLDVSADMTYGVGHPYATRAAALSAVQSVMGAVDMTSDTPIAADSIFPSGQAWEDVTSSFLPAGWTGVTVKMIYYYSNFNSGTGTSTRMWLGANSPGAGWSKTSASGAYSGGASLNTFYSAVSSSPASSNIIPYANGVGTPAVSSLGYWAGLLNVVYIQSYFEAALVRADGLGVVYDSRSTGTESPENYPPTIPLSRSLTWAKQIAQNAAGQIILTSDAFSGFSPPDPSLVSRSVGWDVEYLWLTSPCYDV